MCASVGAIRGQAVVGRPGRSGDEELSGRALEVGEPAGEAVTGSFRTTNLGIVMAESGLRPVECLLTQPGLVLWTGRERGGGVRSGVEEGREVGREEGPHGVILGNVWRGVRGHRARAGGGSGAGQAPQAR